MNRDQFTRHLQDGKPATEAVRLVTGHEPEVVTLADYLDNSGHYHRYGIMMAGPVMAALVVLWLDASQVPRQALDRVVAGEPLGAVIPGLERKGYITPYPVAVQSGAYLFSNGTQIGYAEEIFTASLFTLMARKDNQ